MNVSEAQSRIHRCLDDYFSRRNISRTITIEHNERDFIRVHVRFVCGKYFTRCEIEKYLSTHEIEQPNLSMAEYMLAMRMRFVLEELDRFLDTANQLDRLDRP